jgi:hypothetical protein
MGEARRRYDARNGVQRTLITDDATPGVFHVKHSQDVEPILDSIARDREIMRNDGDFKLTHRIPTVIYEQLQRQGIADDPDLFKAWLNSSEANPWRIWKGTL